MPKGMTPRKRMTRTVGSLAKSLKPSGRLNRDDIKKTKELRKKMSLSEIKDAKRLGRAAQLASKGVAGMGKLMSQGMSVNAAKNLMRKARELKPSGRINMDDIKRIMQKGPRPMRKLDKVPMSKGPNKMDKQKTPMQKALGPIRPLRERSQSKLVSRRRGTSKR